MRPMSMFFRAGAAVSALALVAGCEGLSEPTAPTIEITPTFATEPALAEILMFDFFAPTGRPADGKVLALTRNGPRAYDFFGELEAGVNTEVAVGVLIADFKILDVEAPLALTWSTKAEFAAYVFSSETETWELAPVTETVDTPPKAICEVAPSEFEMFDTSGVQGRVRIETANFAGLELRRIPPVKFREDGSCQTPGSELPWRGDLVLRTERGDDRVLMFDLKDERAPVAFLEVGAGIGVEPVYAPGLMRQTTKPIAGGAFNRGAVGVTDTDRVVVVAREAFIDALTTSGLTLDTGQ